MTMGQFVEFSLAIPLSSFSEMSMILRLRKHLTEMLQRDLDHKTDDDAFLVNGVCQVLVGDVL